MGLRNKLPAVDAAIALAYLFAPLCRGTTEAERWATSVIDHGSH